MKAELFFWKIADYILNDRNNGISFLLYVVGINKRIFYFILILKTSENGDLYMLKEITSRSFAHKEIWVYMQLHM